MTQIMFETFNMPAMYVAIQAVLSLYAAAPHAHAREGVNPSAANRNHYAHSVHPAAVPGSMQAPSWYIPTHSGCTFKTFLEGVFGLDRCKHPRGTGSNRVLCSP